MKSRTIHFLVRRQHPVSQETARKNQLDILTTKEYAARYFLTVKGVWHRIRRRKVKAFKQGGKWFIVLPHPARTGFEHPGV
jgi:hypothetical protein